MISITVTQVSMMMCLANYHYYGISLLLPISIWR